MIVWHSNKHNFVFIPFLDSGKVAMHLIHAFVISLLSCYNTHSIGLPLKTTKKLQQQPDHCQGLADGNVSHLF